MKPFRLTVTQAENNEPVIGKLYDGGTWVRDYDGSPVVEAHEFAKELNSRIKTYMLNSLLAEKARIEVAIKKLREDKEVNKGD